ncbi:MAG: purine-nucleoside phosphorylase, partial [Clostridia bacterium]|nr:purine-nucleoside phosphorylase [Clostridia bacterium]
MSKAEKHPNVSTPHITAQYGDFAKTVLMPGDPLRSKFIAENFLENPVLVNNVRGVNGYTGTYKGKRVSVMASGMGQPSIGIYSYELFNFYGVENIIRVGSCGSFDKDLHVRDIIIALGACTNGNYAKQYNLPGTFCPIADFALARRAA